MGQHTPIRFYSREVAQRLPVDESAHVVDVSTCRAEMILELGVRIERSQLNISKILRMQQPSPQRTASSSIRFDAGCVVGTRENGRF